MHKKEKDYFCNRRVLSSSGNISHFTIYDVFWDLSVLGRFTLKSPHFYVIKKIKNDALYVKHDIKECRVKISLGSAAIAWQRRQTGMMRRKTTRARCD